MDLGINEGALGNWVNAGRRRRGWGDGTLGEDERAELVRLRKENAELAMERVLLTLAFGTVTAKPGYAWTGSQAAGRPGLRDAKVGGLAAGPPVDLGELVVGAREADLALKRHW